MQYVILVDHSKNDFLQEERGSAKESHQRSDQSGSLESRRPSCNLEGSRTIIRTNNSKRKVEGGSFIALLQFSTRFLIGRLFSKSSISTTSKNQIGTSSPRSNTSVDVKISKKD